MPDVPPANNTRKRNKDMKGTYRDQHGTIKDAARLKSIVTDMIEAYKEMGQVPPRWAAQGGRT